MRFFILSLALALSIFSTSGQSVVAETSSDSKSDQFITLGWVERALIFPGGFAVNAKLDTGADNSSLHAEDMEFFQSDGKRHVRFSVFNRHGDRHQLELPVLRSTRIKLKKGGYQSRPVIRLGLCLDDLYREVDFSLVDRSHFYYPMLVGRSFLSGNVLVDSSKTYSAEPRCPSPIS